MTIEVQPLPESDLIGKTTAIVKAFERPDSLRRLLRSLKKFYPEMRVLVADDSFAPGSPPDGVEYVRLPPDVGAGAGRNELLQRIQTPYFWQLDDDFELTWRTDFLRLVAPVADGKADLVAGNCLRCKRKWPGWTRTKDSPFFGSIDLRDGVLQLRAGAEDVRAEYLECDIVPQFFVARTEQILRLGGWDPQLKTEEHEEFFVRVRRAGLRVRYCPHVTVRHWSELPPHYAHFRQRSYRPLAAAKMGVHTWIDMDGRERRFEVEAKAA